MQTKVLWHRGVSYGLKGVFLLPNVRLTASYIDNPNLNDSRNVSLQACMHKVPVDMSERGSKWPEKWPVRLEKPPYWLNEVGVYGKPGQEDFTADYEQWKDVVSHTYLNGIGVRWSSIRNVMDMKAVYGGLVTSFASAMIYERSLLFPFDMSLLHIHHKF